MGSFYVNITLRGPEQAMVEKTLAEEKRTAFVSPTVNRFTVVCDRECDAQDVRTIGQVASTLSEVLSCPAFAVLNHDDDIFWYQLYENGQLADEYDSCPDYFCTGDGPSEPAGGNASKLCELMGGSDPSIVESILRNASYQDDGYLFALERHQDLAAALGIPAFSVGLGYDYLSAGEVPEGIDLADFVRLEEGQRLEIDSDLVSDEDQPVEEAGSPDSPLWDDDWRSILETAMGGPRITSPEAIEIAKRHFGDQGDILIENSTPEAWLLPRADQAVWMVILLSSSPTIPGSVVYVDSVTGQVVNSRPFLKGRRSGEIVPS